MSDFVTRLRSELVDAAAREQRGRRPRLALPRLGPLVPSLGALVVALLALALVLGREQAGDEGPPAVPSPTARPLFGGSLEGGVRYGTRALRPPLSFEPGDANWLARVADRPDVLVLERRQPRRDAGPSTEPPPRGYMSFGRVGRVYDPAVADRERSLTEPPADLLAWVQAHPDVEAGSPRDAQLAGLDARVLDFTVRFDQPTHAAPECRFTGVRCTALVPGVPYRSGERQRLYVVETRPGPLLVAINGFDEADFAAMLPQAQRLLDSLEIGG